MISCVFVRDYFEILHEYIFYQILSNKLVTMKYDTREEIFKYQSILAVHESKDINRGK